VHARRIRVAAPQGGRCVGLPQLLEDVSACCCALGLGSMLRRILVQSVRTSSSTAWRRPDDNDRAGACLQPGDAAKKQVQRIAQPFRVFQGEEMASGYVSFGSILNFVETLPLAAFGDESNVAVFVSELWISGQASSCLSGSSM
jgi:hypothetical protein